VKASHNTTSTSWSQHHFVAIGSLSSKCAKFHTVAASNNRDHASQSLSLLLVRATYIYCSLHTSRSWWITHSTQRHWRGCNTILIYLAQGMNMSNIYCLENNLLPWKQSIALKRYLKLFLDWHFQCDKINWCNISGKPFYMVTQRLSSIVQKLSV